MNNTPEREKGVYPWKMLNLVEIEKQDFGKQVRGEA